MQDTPACLVYIVVRIGQYEIYYSTVNCRVQKSETRTRNMKRRANSPSSDDEEGKMILWPTDKDLILPSDNKVYQYPNLCTFTKLIREPEQARYVPLPSPCAQVHDTNIP